MDKKQHITLNIADAAPIDLYIERNREEQIREIAKKINLMWAKYSKDFPQKTSKDILAMIAFRWAQIYYELDDSLNVNEAALEEAEQALDAILLEVK